MQFKALSFLAALIAALLAASASPVPQPQLPDVGSLPGILSTAGGALGEVGGTILPGSINASGTKGAGGTPGPEQDIPDAIAGPIGGAIKELVPALADGAIAGAGGKPGTD